MPSLSWDSVQRELNKTSKYAQTASKTSFSDIQHMLSGARNEIKLGVQEGMREGTTDVEAGLRRSQVELMNRLKPILLIGGALLGFIGLAIFIKKT